MSSNTKIEIFTDGSCNTKLRIGAWAALIFTGDKKIDLHGEETNTTHNRMELLAAIKALEYIDKNNCKIIIYSDSQYLVDIQIRRNKLKINNYLTKKGEAIQNKDLVEKVVSFLETMDLELIKVKAHLKKNETSNFNREVDKLSRKIVRESCKNLIIKEKKWAEQIEPT